jgi:outer membrane protein TolC
MLAALVLLAAAAPAAPAAPAARPADLAGLVDVALGRDPEVRALSFDAEAALARASAARRPMDPQVMVGVESLGVPMDDVDPTMGMLGATQMLRGGGEGAASSARLSLDATRSEVDGDRLVADLRTRLWQSAARIGALDAELGLLDAQVRSASALLDMALARYGAGATGAAAMGDGAMGAMEAMPSDGGMAMGAEPPAVVPRGSGGGMPGMSGMGGSSSRPAAAPIPSAGMAAVEAAPSVGGGAGAGGLAALLRLDAGIARLEADRAALGFELDGELAVLAVFVGAEATAAVRAAPHAYLGVDAGGEVPERRLAEVDAAAAAADVRVARAARRPDLMVSVAQRFMPEGMPNGTDVSVGVEVPLWGGRGRAIDAANAALSAAEARSDRVDRDLEVALARSRAALEAARDRAAALDERALPRARQAWEASVAGFAAGALGQEEVVRVWESSIAIEREAVAARRDVQLRAAELARLGGP